MLDMLERISCIITMNKLPKEKRVQILRALASHVKKSKKIGLGRCIDAARVLEVLNNVHDSSPKQSPAGEREDAEAEAGS